MYKFIVYWIVITHYTYPCNDQLTTGFETASIYVVCEKVDYAYKHKDFWDRKEAFEFYGAAKGQIKNNSDIGIIDSVKIDSIYIK